MPLFPKQLQTMRSDEAAGQAREAEASDTSPAHDQAADLPALSAASTPAAPGRPLTAEEVFARWAVTGHGPAAHLCYRLGRHLRDAPADLSLSAAAPCAEHSPIVHLLWNRLRSSGASALIDDWRLAAERAPTLNNAKWATRVCRLIEQVVRDDPTAALAAIHGASPSAMPLDQRFEALEAVLAFARAVPEPQPSDRSRSAATATSRGVGHRRGHLSGGSDAGEGLATAALLAGTGLLSDALGPRALRPQVSMLSQSSGDSSPLTSLDLQTFALALSLPLSDGAPEAIDAPAYQNVLFDELAASPVTTEDLSPAPSEASQAWSWSSWGGSVAGDSQASTASMPSWGSLAWLPSMRTTTDASQSPVSGDFSAGLPSTEDLVAGRQVLSCRSCPGLSKADALQRDWALGLVSSYLDGSRQLPFMSREETRALAWITATMVRRTMAFGPAGGDEGDPTRPPAAAMALNRIAAWVGEASGVEGVRRERWLQYLTDRSFDPEARLQLAAPLLVQGVELPPGDALDVLLPRDSLCDRGTLLWRGQALPGGPSLANLLDRLGIRHLDIAEPLRLSSPALRPLQDTDVLVATLHGTRAMSSTMLKERIAALEKALPALYELRLNDQRDGVDRAAMPPGWIPDPHVVGQLRQARRDANRKRMGPVRDLWPQGRMPPALRAHAVNALPGAEPVLDFIGRLRRQRAATGQFETADIELCAHLIGILDGLSKDAEFVERCRRMAAAPAGPCVDGGTLTLSAMSALRDALEATSLDEVAENAFLQACLARASAVRAERRPGFDETLEEAMVLRWHVSAALAEMLDSRRIRVTDKPVFGAYVEGEDWDSPARRGAFREEALSLVLAEVEHDFPGVVMLLSAQDDPLAATFQARVDQEPGFSAFDQRRAAAHAAFDDADSSDEEALGRTGDALQRIDQAQHQARFHALEAPLAAIRAKVRAAAGSQDAPAERAGHVEA